MGGNSNENGGIKRLEMILIKMIKAVKLMKM